MHVSIPDLLLAMQGKKAKEASIKRQDKIKARK